MIEGRIANPAAQQVYDQLWDGAMAAFARGDVQLDAHLTQRDSDRRRGISLIARLGTDVTAKCCELLHEIRNLEPDLHYYRGDEQHVTVMSLISASETFELQRAPIALFRSTLNTLFRQVEPFTIVFDGITASPGSVMLQGYAADDSLNKLRDAIRSELGRFGLAGGLDHRYRITTAHATIVRFCSQPRDLQKLIALLRTARERHFGAVTVAEVEFVANDWYM